MRRSHPCLFVASQIFTCNTVDCCYEVSAVSQRRRFESALHFAREHTLNDFQRSHRRQCIFFGATESRCFVMSAFVFDFSLDKDYSRPGRIIELAWWLLLNAP